MGSLLQSELFRVRRRPQTWISVAIVVVGTVLYYLGFTIAHFLRPNSTSINDTLALASADNDGLIILQILGPIVAVVVGASLIGSEYGWNTMRSLVARSRSRATLLTAKWAVAGLYVLALAAAAVVTAYAGSTIALLVTGQDLGWSASEAGSLLGAIGRNALSIAPTVAIALLVATVARSNAAAIAVGIAVLFVEPILLSLLVSLSDAFNTVKEAGISWNTSRIAQFRSGVGDTTTREFLISVAIVAAWMVAALAVSVRIFQRRDVTSG